MNVDVVQKAKVFLIVVIILKYVELKKDSLLKKFHIDQSM